MIKSLKAQETLHVPESALWVIAVVNDFFLLYIIFAINPCLELSIAFIQWLTQIGTYSGD